MVGDPQFVGFRGQSYQVHGIDGAVYNLVSSPTLHVNARFVFLDRGACPVLNGTRDTNCWSHPGSYLGAVAMRLRSTHAAAEHRLLATAGDRLTGFAAVSVDGAALELGSAVEPTSGVRVERVSTHLLRVTTPELSFELSNSDGFINEAVRVNVPLSQLSRQGVHGLLGQTHRRGASSGLAAVVEGDVDDYVVLDGELFGTACVYNRYSAAT